MQGRRKSWNKLLVESGWTEERAIDTQGFRELHERFGCAYPDVLDSFFKSYGELQVRSHKESPPWNLELDTTLEVIGQAVSSSLEQERWRAIEKEIGVSVYFVGIHHGVSFGRGDVFITSDSSFLVENDSVYDLGNDISNLIGGRGKAL